LAGLLLTEISVELRKICRHYGQLTLSTALPAGTRVWVNIYYTNAAGIPFVYTDSIGADQAAGDLAQYAVSGVPNTTATGADPVNTQNGVGFYPVAFIARTSVKSQGITGDSIAAGKGDVPSGTTGLGGIVERSLGITVPFINVANSGASANSIAGPTGYLRRQLLAYVDEIIVMAGTNDVIGATAPSAVMGNLTAVADMVYPRPVSLCNLLPMTTGAWAVGNGSDQTVIINDATGIAVNQYINGRQSTFKRVFNTRAPVQNGTSARKWTALMTDDGIHPNALGVSTIVAAKSIQVN
jgi:lysophospholipase L1-like esterase